MNFLIDINGRWEKTVNRTATPWCAERVLLGINKAFNELAGKTFEERMVVFENKNSSWYTREEDMAAVKRAIVFKIKSKNFLAEEKNVYEKALKKIKRNIYKLKRYKRFSDIGNEKILELLNEFTEKFINFSHYGMVSVIMDSILSAEINSEDRDFLMVLTKPKQMTRSYKEKIEFLRLAREFKKTKILDEDLIKKHWLKYCWLPVFFGDEFYSMEYFLNNFSEKIDDNNIEMEAKKVETYFKFLRQEQKEAKYKVDKKMAQLAERVGYYGYRRMIFAETVGMANYYILPLMAEIAKRINIKAAQIQFLTTEEIRKSLEIKESIVSKEERLKRITRCILVQKDQETEIRSGAMYEKVKKTEAGRNLPQGKKLVGIGVSSGKISGRVRVIKSAKELGKLKKGEIIVTPMTSIDYMVAIRKAGAIITDEGGLACHAAIVSREIGVPCIVGTKTATAVLKDGDFVEVDANEGVVLLK